MVTSSKVVNQLMEDAAEYIYDTYEYLGVGTGTAEFVDAAVNLSSGVAIGTLPSEYRKLQNSSSTGSILNGRQIIKLFTLEPGEPASQPVNLGEVGYFKGSGSADDLGVGAKLNAVQTKDNTVKQRWRMSLKFNRASEVQ